MENPTIKRPDIKVVLVEDRDYSNAELFSGEARTLNPESFADNGIRFRHTQASNQSPVC